MQRIIQGIGRLHQIMSGINCRKLFLVIDSSYMFLNIRETIEALDVVKVRFSDFSPNPIYEDICKGIETFRVNGCDAIIAVGGGSTIDVAKCIKLVVLAEEGNSSIIPPLVAEQLPIDGSKIPFIAIPTTAGTGSESTHNAVMYYEGAKQTVVNDEVLPDYAILEPSVLKTLPLYQKKCTMMDALCQGIESWWSVNATDESKKYSMIAVKLLIKYWHAYIFENDSEAAVQIMLAANYAGRAINIAQTTAAHAMSYKITSLYGLPHGHAVAVCLPEIWEFMLEKDLPVFEEIAEAMDCGSANDAIVYFRRMMSDMELPNPIAADRKLELDVLCKSVNPVRLKNNPVSLDQKAIIAIYNKIMILSDC